MKEDTQVNTYTDSPCKTFVQHRFKLSHCAQCFKPKSHHPQFFDSIAKERIGENVRVVEITPNGGDRTPVRLDKKYDTRSNSSKTNSVVHKSARLLEDGVLDKKLLVGKTQELRKQFECKEPDGTPPLTTGRGQTRNGATQSPTPQKKYKPSTPLKDKPGIMNIPQESTSISLINDLNSNSNHNGAINEHYQSDSDSDILSDTPPSGGRFWRGKCSPKPTRAMDPIPTLVSDVNVINLLDDKQMSALKTKFGSTAHDAVKQNEYISTDGNSSRAATDAPNEFQRLVRSLRHVDPPAESPSTQRKAIRRYDAGRASTPNRITAVKADAKERKTAVSLKSDSVRLAQNVGNSAVLKSSNQSTNHNRQPIDASNGSDAVVTSQLRGKDAINQGHKQAPASDKLSNVISNLAKTTPSDLPINIPPKPKPRRNKAAAAYAPVQVPQLDLAGKNVKIISRDGRVTYYDGSPKSTPRSPTKSVDADSKGDLCIESPIKSVTSNGNCESTPKSPTKSIGSDSNGELSPSRVKAAKAYFVVDISSNPPQGLSTADRRSICGPPLPCTPAPRSRPASQISTQSFESDSGDDGRPRHKGSRSSLALSDDISRRSLILEDDSGIIMDRCNSVDSALTVSTYSDVSPVKHSTASTTPESKMLIDSKRDTPPFPMLLDEKDKSEAPVLPSANSRRNSREKRRSTCSNSSYYKVPIFIQPQNYDNLGTAKSDSETKLNELAGTKTYDVDQENVPEPPVRLSSEDYLMPMMMDQSHSNRNSAELDIVISPKSSNNRDSGSFSATSDTENMKSPNVDSQPFVSSQTQANNRADFRGRTKSHPCEPLYAKISHEGRKTSVPTKQKRTAPAPPDVNDDQQNGYDDTMPRSDPPPPPVPVKGKSLSCDGLVVDLPKNQGDNIYSQSPHRRPSFESAHSRRPSLRPKPFLNGEEVVLCKPQAPTASPNKMAVDSPKKTSVETQRSEPPVKSSTAEVIYQTPEHVPAKHSSGSYSEITIPAPMNFKSVREKSSVKMSASHSPAPIWTKEGSPMKGKAPVPSQIRNARNIAPSPVKIPPQNSAAPHRSASSPPVRRTTSPQETDMLHRKGSASPVLQRVPEAKCNAISRSAAPSPPLGRVVENKVKTAVNNITTRSAPSPPPGRVDGEAKTTPEDLTIVPVPLSRTISPLPPNSPVLHRRPGQLPQVPDDTITKGPLMEKSKKSKLPWKWRKRKDDTSPEREFNAEPVQKWLDEIQKMQLEDLSTQRHSFDRLDVINAYKGQPTADIVQKYPKIIQNIEDIMEDVVEEVEGPSPRRNSTVKRQAPRIPSGEQGEGEDKVEELPGFQKSYSLSPTSRRKRMESCDDGENVYENIGKYI